MNALKQYVPSSVCLKCEGCCRFQTADSPWRPKWDKREFIDEEDFVTTIQECGKHLCRFFNSQDSTCRVYADRPFECQLYPFVLSRETGGIKVYVHLACPFIQEHQNDPGLREYVGYLRGFFELAVARDFLRRNAHLAQDYRPYLGEMAHVFTIQTSL